MKTNYGVTTRNFVAKNMNKVCRPSTHRNKKAYNRASQKKVLRKEIGG